MPSFNILGNSYTCFFYMSSVFSENLGAQERRAGVSLASIYAFRMFGIFMIMPVFALYGEKLPGATPLLMGLALGIYGLTQAILQVPFAMWSDRIGRKPVIVGGCASYEAALHLMRTGAAGVLVGSGVVVANLVGGDEMRVEVGPVVPMRSRDTLLLAGVM